jgi:hypothetical protein
LATSGTPCAAAPRTIDDCEKITAADAYNKCLASFGPVAHEHQLQPVAPQDGPGPSYTGRRAARRHAWPQVVTHGPQRMEFSISPRRNRR